MSEVSRATVHDVRGEPHCSLHVSVTPNGATEVGWPQWSTAAAPATFDASPCMACVLFLEDDRPEATAARQLSGATESRVWDALVGSLDWLIRRFQPPPHMLHAELLLLSPTGEAHHFSTYVGDTANWRTDDEAYYSTHKWRAMPIDGGQNVGSLADACDKSIGAPYSILRYPLSTRTFGWLAGLVSDRIGSPAHCAALTARLLRIGVGADRSSLLPRPSPRYSPSDLYNAIGANAWAIDFVPTVATREEMDDLEVLTSGTDTEVRRLDAVRRARAAKALANNVRAAMIVNGAETDPVLLRQFAWVLVRVADAYRSGPVV